MQVHHLSTADSLILSFIDLVTVLSKAVTVRIPKEKLMPLHEYIQCRRKTKSFSDNSFHQISLSPPPTYLAGPPAVQRIAAIHFLGTESVAYRSLKAHTEKLPKNSSHCRI